MEIQDLLEYIGWPYLSTAEINEADRPGWMRERRDPKSLEISNHFSLFGSLRDGSI